MPKDWDKQPSCSPRYDRDNEDITEFEDFPEAELEPTIEEEKNVYSRGV